MDDLARKNNVTAIIDCGVAPGMDNILLGYHNENMDVDYFECLVGGLPLKKEWPFQYKAPFSPIDVIEEYSRPARIVRNSKIITKPALSNAEEIAFDEVGILEAFNTDGLRTLLKTMNIRDMIEKTLRYPGHIEYIQVLKDTGFFDTIPVTIHGKEVRPIDLTAQLLFPKWKLEEGEEEFTVMRVTIKGKENGKPKTYTYNLLDRYDKNTGTTSMARTTGYTCTAVSRLLLDGKFTRKGICAPEFIGATENCLGWILDYFMARYLVYNKLEYSE